MPGSLKANPLLKFTTKLYQCSYGTGHGMIGKRHPRPPCDPLLMSWAIKRQSSVQMLFKQPATLWQPNYAKYLWERHAVSSPLKYS